MSHGKRFLPGADAATGALAQPARLIHNGWSNLPEIAAKGIAGDWPSLADLRHTQDRKAPSAHYARLALPVPAQLVPPVSSRLDSTHGPFGHDLVDQVRNILVTILPEPSPCIHFRLLRGVLDFPSVESLMSMQRL